MTALIAAFAVDADGVASGHVCDPGEPQTRFVVEILADGLPVALVRAHHHRAGVGVGDGCYGFSAALAEDVLARTGRLEARLANVGTVVGSAAPPFGAVPRRAGAGLARWDGGLRISGWLDAPAADPPPVVKALLDGCEVARAACRSFAHVDRIVRAFTLDLPRDLADGRVRTVDVMTEEGVDIPGSPCLVFALADGFAGLVDAHAELESERARARFADGLLPDAVPFCAYAAWKARFPVPAPAAGGRVVVLIVGEEGLDATLASLDGQAGVGWSAAVLPAARSRAEFEPRPLADLAAAARGADLVVAAVGGTRFEPGALALLADAARRHPHSPAFYGDAAVGEGDDARPLGHPAYDDELLLEQGYPALCFALRPAEVARAAAAGCASLYALFPEPDAGTGAAGLPVHLPTPLATLPDVAPDALAPALRDATARRLAGRGVAAEVTTATRGDVPSVRVRRRTPPRAVSVLIPSRDGGGALGLTLDALAAACGPDAPAEVVVADNASTDPAARLALAEAEARGHAVLRLRGLFSEAHLLNRAAAAARSDVLLVLRPGVVPAGPGWLDEMLGRCTGAVGAVGGLVAWSDGGVREAGLVLGPRFSAVPRFRDRHAGEPGYAGRLAAAHEVGAVSAACLMMPRRRFDALGGFDDSASTSLHHDVDYCLRLREGGGRVLFTPHARFVCDAPEPVPRGATEVGPVHGREVARLRARWRLAPGCDPFYSPWMSMGGTPYAGLAWPPVPYAPRQPAPWPARHPRPDLS